MPFPAVARSSALLLLLAACAAPPPGDADVDAGPGEQVEDAGPVDAGPLPAECTAPSPKQPPALPIVNGRPEPTLYTMTAGQQLAVGALLTPVGGSVWGNSCTATLVAPDVVLTAAHCVYSRRSTPNPAGFRFGIGPDMDEPLHVFSVRSIHIHPDYASTRRGDDSQMHDVAILRLTESAVAVEPTLQPIRVNHLELTPADEGQSIQTVGYGATSTRDSGNSRKFWVTEEIHDVQPWDLVLDGNGVGAVCFGDSGGPAIYQLEGELRVAGVVSWGDASCRDQDHFARVDKNLDWMERPDVGGDLRAPPDPNAPEPCFALTADGLCDGDTVRRCAGGRPAAEDCAATGRRCVTASGVATCVADPCEGEDFLGRCDGAVAVWCDGERVRRFDCGACGRVCGWTGWSVGAFCE